MGKNNSNMINSKMKIYCLAIFCCLLWASSFVGLKICLQYLPPLILAGIRFILAGILLLPLWLMLVKQPFRKLRQHIWLILLVSLFQTIFAYGLFNSGINLVPGAIAAILNGSAPLIMAIVAHIATRDDKLSWRKSLCFISAFIGIIIIALNRNLYHDAGALEIIGIVLLLLAFISAAFGNLVVRKLKINPLMLNSSQIFIGGVVLLTTGLWSEKLPMHHFPLVFYLALGWLVILSALAFSIWFYLLHQPTVKPSELNMWEFIIPIFGAVFSWILLADESPDIGSIVGMSCIVGAMIFYHIKPIKRKNNFITHFFS
jgi:drug/metabolite transporter (DMT)-like permease